MSRKQTISSCVNIRDIEGEESYLAVFIDDSEFHEPEDNMKIPLRLLRRFHKYIGERIEFLEQHSLLEKKGGER